MNKDIYQPEDRYYCAGRYCVMKDNCHRYTSSTSVNRAPFEDYDLVALRKRSCSHFIDRDIVQFGNNNN